MSAPATMECHVCGGEARLLGAYRPYIDVESAVYECGNCESYISPHLSDAHLKLHSGDSTYNFHYGQADACKDVLRANGIDGLRNHLGRLDKFRFVIDEVERLVPAGGRILETGCSTGSLASWMIAAGYDFLGIDVAPDAILKARECFGDHFHMLDEVDLANEAPFDAIYHVGTIGCVDHPFQLTADLLSLLKPGGVLLFNAPNRRACTAPRQLWVEGTHPPDLVSLFVPEVWEKHFSDIANTDVTVDFLKGWNALKRQRQSRAKRAWEWKPYRKFVEGRRTRSTPQASRLVRRLAGKALLKLTQTRDLLSSPFCRNVVPAESGVYVRMTRRAA